MSDLKFVCLIMCDNHCIEVGVAQTVEKVMTVVHYDDSTDT